MTSVDLKWVNTKLNEIEPQSNARELLANWFNSLSAPRQRQVFQFAGWLDVNAYVGHHMDHSGSDRIFEELASTLNIK